ncbi:anti-sigma factor family protein [Defluviimonas sp. SAOS-178_SWC]|uniref:anti-sigma factor family protein n=1 Tax=Defluviimonas sp. SAOS-178_SWC TaxID=3121287 RepID=UPI0032214577
MSGHPPIPEDDLIRFHAGAITGADRDTMSRRIEDDPAARACLDDWSRQDESLRAAYDGTLDEALPEPLRQRLAEARRQDRAGMRRRLAGPLRIAAAVALLAIGGIGGFILARLDSKVPAQVRVADAALAAYTTYVAEVAHPVEVTASESAHLTQWLSKRLGHPIAPPDFAAAGFRLMGGRLLPSPTGPAALFMYEDDLGRRVTLYVAPGEDSGDTAFRFAERPGAQSFYWIDGSLSYAVTGDIPRDALRAIAVAAYDQMI